MLLKILFFLLLVCPDFAFSKPKLSELVEHPENVKISLLTVDRGALVYMMAGHTLLRIQDKKNGFDFVYNWGVFDFKTPNLAKNYIHGVMKYNVGVWTYQLSRRYYEKMNRRTVWEEEINLSSKQKKTVMNRVIWWTKPENRVYSYDIMLNNCSTIIRDIIDEALEGKLKKTLIKNQHDDNFRNHVDEYYSYFPYTQIPFQIISSSVLDAPLNGWDYLYLPFNLHKELKKVPISSGGVSNGKMLLGQTKVISKGKDYEKPFPYLHWILGFVFIMYSWFVIIKKPTAKSHFLHKNIVYFYTSLFMFMSGVFSIIMIYGWAATTHVFIHHNLNLFLLWPTDILFGIVFFLVVFFKFKKIKSYVIKVIKYYSLFHLFGVCVYLFSLIFSQQTTPYASWVFIMNIVLVFASAYKFTES